MPDVQAAAHGRRRGVDRVDVLARLGAVEGVGVVLLPAGAHGLETLQRRLVRYDDVAGGAGVVSASRGLWVSVMREILAVARPAETSSAHGANGSHLGDVIVRAERFGGHAPYTRPR